ncbi:hypothetical protein [Burkholderia stagnalis]|uniref:hypothetical protein n=1 Tax=Burkholderia stagnalis TaxID=1503054 RepID=UPI000F55DF06|nr:hypothetical protein [Burkholderia stagnalis]
MNMFGVDDCNVVCERRLYLVRESARCVLSQFSTGELFEDIYGAYGGGLLGGFYGLRAELSKDVRWWLRERVRELRVNEVNIEYRKMMLSMYRVGLLHGEAIRLGGELLA